MAADLSEHMRLQLARAGIAIDPPAQPSHARPATSPAREVDRAAIRAILIERGARPEEIDWLTNSAPSLEAARSFTPTRKL